MTDAQGRSSSKLHNLYDCELGETFRKAPKTVIAAVAVSMLIRVFGEDCNIEAEFNEEWFTLWENGIVPQKPGCKWREPAPPIGEPKLEMES